MGLLGYDEFDHRRMMSVFHGGRLHVKSVPLGQVTHLGRVIVSEHDRAGGTGGKFEEVFVIHVVARVKTSPRPLSSCRVGRVQEKRGPLRAEMTADEVKCVPFDKFHAVAAKTDPPDPAGKCFGVPAGRDSSAVFTRLHDTSAGSENSASLDAVAQNCLKSVLHFIARLPAEILQHARTGEAVVEYPPSKRLSPALLGEKNPPNTGNMRIFFAQQNPFCEVLHGRGKADNRASAILNFLLILFIAHSPVQRFYRLNMKKSLRARFTLIALATQILLGIAAGLRPRRAAYLLPPNNTPPS